jgi:hypothetical protein
MGQAGCGWLFCLAAPSWLDLLFVSASGAAAAVRWLDAGSHMQCVLKFSTRYFHQWEMWLASL